MSINNIAYHNSIEQDEFPSPNSTNEPACILQAQDF